MFNLDVLIFSSNTELCQYSSGKKRNFQIKVCVYMIARVMLEGFWLSVSKECLKVLKV